MSESDFIELMVKFAKQTRTTIEIEGRGKMRRVLFTSYDGMVDYTETMVGFHEPGWASWCAFRLLHPVAHHEFETEVRALFESYKKGDRKWITYNEEKRALLHKYLKLAYDPKRWRK
ncbi:hypothetical protein GC167_05910, partial [bacterium]|nr:hypothetical protein [bacterium]